MHHATGNPLSFDVRPKIEIAICYCWSKIKIFCGDCVKDDNPGNSDLKLIEDKIILLCNVHIYKVG